MITPELDRQLTALGVDYQQLIKEVGAVPKCQKSNAAQSKSIDRKILESLETYKWRETASMLYFAMSLEVSEGYLRLRLKALEQADMVEAFKDGESGGKPRTIYRLKNID